jgi:hypothetical protein
MSQYDKPKVRRIVLPSGRSIEVVRFDETRQPARPLHLCPSCESNLVQPVDWSERPESQWELTLECPNCAWTESGVFDRAQIETLEDQLDEWLAAMIEDLRRLTQANMASDVDRFISALNAGVILPEDF